MKKLAIIIIILANTLFVQAEELTQTIRGRVFDSETKSPLAGATLVVLNTNPLKGAYSDKNGNFTIKDVPVGRHKLRCTYIGYQPAIKSNLILSSAKEMIVEIAMEEQISKSEEIVVSAQNKKEITNIHASVSARSFSVEESARYAGAIQDPARMASNYAGVVSVNDERNDIIIRGNSPTGLLWKLEGINIPNPNHYSMAGTTGGGISILNNNNLANSDFFTGAFPAEYGNALSGVFDLSLKKGNDKNFEYMAQLAALGLEAGIEGPLFGEGNGSFIANYRYSTIGMIDKMGGALDDLPGTPNYQDLVFRIDLPKSESLGNFHIFSIAGKSDMSLTFKDQDDDDFDVYDENPWKNTADDHYMAVLGLTQTLTIDKNTYLKNTFAFTSFENKLEVDTVFKDWKTSMIQNSINSEDKFIFNSSYYQRFNAKNNLKLGLSVDYSNFTFIDSVYNEESELFDIYNDIEDNNTLIQTYAQWQHKFSDDFLVNTGIHFQYLTFNSTQSVEPRLNIKWNFAGGQALSFGTGLFSQAQPFNFYTYETKLEDGSMIRTNKDLDFTKSVHAVLGYDLSLGDNMRIKVEPYYQYLYDIPVEKQDSYFSLANVGADFELPFVDSLINKGTAQNIGVDLTFEKFFSNGYYFLFTASIYDSKYTASDDKERSTAFNGQFALTALAGYELSLSSNSTLVFDTRLGFAGGKRYIPFNIAASKEAGKALYNYNRAYEEQYKNYFAWDLKFGYRLNLAGSAHYIMIDLRNVMSYKNELKQLYDPKNDRFGMLNQMAIIPNFYYKVEF